MTSRREESASGPVYMTINASQKNVARRAYEVNVLRGRQKLVELVLVHEAEQLAERRDVDRRRWSSL